MKKFLYTVGCMLTGCFTVKQYMVLLHTKGNYFLYSESSVVFAILLCLAASTWENEFAQFKAWTHKHACFVLTVTAVAAFFFTRFIGQLADKYPDAELVGVYLISGMFLCSVSTFAAVEWFKQLPYYRQAPMSAVSNDTSGKV